MKAVAVAISFVVIVEALTFAVAVAVVTAADGVACHLAIKHVCFAAEQIY